MPSRLRGARGPLWGLGEGIKGSQSLRGVSPSGATGVWGSWGLISNQADMILLMRAIQSQESRVLFWALTLDP